MNEPIMSDKVLQWPEFQALAKRLQVDLTQRITRLDLMLDMDRPARLEIALEASENPYFSG